MSQPQKSEPIPDGCNDLDRADMQRLVSGQDGALNDLIERHAPRLFNYLVRSLQNEEDASDIAQEVFVRLYQNRAKFDPSQKFTTWLYAIASNLVRTQFRFRGRHPQISLDAPNAPTEARFLATTAGDTASPSQSLQEQETAGAVRSAIAELPEELRTPLLLFEYEDLSQAQIGEILRCSEKAVETRLYRARKLLKSSLSRFLNA